MDRREFAKLLAPTALLGLAASPLKANQEEPLFLHSLSHEPFLFGHWFQTWGQMMAPEGYENPGLVAAQIGLFRVAPSTYIWQHSLIPGKSQAYAGEVVALRYQAASCKTCKEPTCICHSLPPSDNVLALGQTANTVVLSEPPGLYQVRYYPCSLCGTVLSLSSCLSQPIFRHAKPPRPHLWLCWHCYRKEWSPE